MVDSIQNTLSEIWAQTRGKEPLINGDDENGQPYSADIWSHLDASLRSRVWMKILGRKGLPNRATEVLLQQLHSATEVPGIAVWNSVLDAWAEAATTDEKAVAEAFVLFRLLQNDRQCRQAGVRPNVATYGCMLKVCCDRLLHVVCVNSLFALIVLICCFACCVRQFPCTHRRDMSL